MSRVAGKRSESQGLLAPRIDGPVVPDEEVVNDPLIDHPDYYGGAGNPYEAIEVIKAWIGADSTLGFCVGNTLKYLCRAGRKEPDSFHSLKQDLKKARWYLNFAIDLLSDEDEA